MAHKLSNPYFYRPGMHWCL